MPSTRKILRAFFASLGDLQEERRAVRDGVAEFNESFAQMILLAGGGHGWTKVSDLYTDTQPFGLPNILMWEIEERE